MHKTSLRLIRRFGGQRARHLRTRVHGGRAPKDAGARRHPLHEKQKQKHSKKHQNSHKNHECPLEHIQHVHRCFKRSQRHSSSKMFIAKSCTTTKGTPTPTPHAHGPLFTV